MTIYPNPADKSIEMIFNKNSIGNNIQIYDISGKIILEKTIYNTIQQKVDISNLNKGVYFVKVGGLVHKLIKE